MTTKGKALRSRGACPIDVGDGEPFPLHELADRIDRHPVPIEVSVPPGSLSPAAQRLYATLGVLVRFVDD